MPSSKATMLIVDDEPSIRFSLSQSLAEMGYCARLATDGFSALREIRNRLPDFLLSDLNMPGMSGFELLAIVRRRFPAIRTIAMGGLSSGDEVPFGVAADGYFQKGSSILMLMRIMESLPRMERFAYQPSCPEAPIWIQANSPELAADEQVIITCPECMRTFPQTLGTGYLRRKTDCVHCYSTIHYAIVPPTGQTLLRTFPQRAEQTEPYQLSEFNSSN
jgi:CheY-like chemotaxis protein